MAADGVMTAAARPAGAPPPLPPHDGFRHFLGGPPPGKQFLVDGKDPRHDAAARATLQRRMAGLSRAMEADRFEENPNLPSGYTYFLQFIAHDLVQTQTPVWAAGAAGLRNMRNCALVLDALYGGGPGACPIAYAGQPGEAGRGMLRLGQVQPGISGRDPRTCPFRDIPRLAAPGISGAPQTGRPEVALADARNDDNALVSQMTVLWSLLHNAVLKSLGPVPKRGPRVETISRSHANFACARLATTLIYRAVIEQDLLERLLQPEVLAHFARLPAAEFDCHQKDGLALEFSHAAFRLGHAMLRDAYAINAQPPRELGEVIKTNSSVAPNQMPLSEDWLVRWGHFFEVKPPHGLPPADFNFSRRLGTRLSPRLVNAEVFPVIDETGRVGLVHRDLMSTCLAGLWSVDALYDAVARRYPGLLAKATLADKKTRTARLAARLGESPGATRLDEADVASLADSPPLAFYILFEAEQEMRGERLGPLGSILVAESILGTLRCQPLAAEIGHDQLPQRLAALAADFPGSAAALGKLGHLTTMPAVVEFVAGSGIVDQPPAFI